MYYHYGLEMYYQYGLEVNHSDCVSVEHGEYTAGISVISLETLSEWLSASTFSLAENLSDSLSAKTLSVEMFGRRNLILLPPEAQVHSQARDFVCH